MDVSTVYFWIESLLTIFVIGATARWMVGRFFRGSTVTCPQCQREARWLGNLPAQELQGYCLYCSHCGIMISVLETEQPPEDRRISRSTFDPRISCRGLEQGYSQPPHLIEDRARSGVGSSYLGIFWPSTTPRARGVRKGASRDDVHQLHVLHLPGRLRPRVRVTVAGPGSG